MNFHMKVVKSAAGGELVDVEGPNTAIWVRSNTLFDLLDRIEERKRAGGPQRCLFPWYQRSFDYHSGRKPEPSDCYRPKDVLSSLQSIERELQKNTSKYPFEWTFWVPQSDGSRKGLKTLNVHYQGKRCRLFGDEQGCWAAETDTPLAFPVHYELTDLPEVVARLEPDGLDVTIRIERTSFLTMHAEMLQQMKRVCLSAMQNGALLLTSIG